MSSSSHPRPAVSARRLVRLVFLLLIPFLLLALAEMVLRVYPGLPTGLFCYLETGPQGMYPPSETMILRFGPIAYRVRSNRLGLRGPDLDMPKPHGRFRLLTLGDSVTDGFFVDDPDTYPHQLSNALRIARPTLDFDLASCARGGGSIDLARRRMKKLGFSLQPDLVLLLFVTNDITDLLEAGVPTDLDSAMGESFIFRLSRAFLTRTALGEGLGWLVLRRYGRQNPAPFHPPLLDETRYHFAGSDEVETNIQTFRRHFSHRDGQLESEPFSADIEAGITEYLTQLDALDAGCRQRSARLALAYFPSYAEVHDPASLTPMARRLENHCRRRGIPFCDLTSAFRHYDGRDVLYLAPKDFHPSPAGNRFLAERLKDFLLDQGLLPDETP